MANNLVKWWKTKFLNGYRQFSVECGKISDTEGLLERLSSEDDLSDRLRTTCVTPPVQSTQIPSTNDSPKKQNQPSSPRPTPSPATTTTPEHQLNFEEFSCDVSVENNEKKPGQDRQEFSFTLYDFDGHGKITKDDIAGLVTTIYEALGSSVKVPHYGSKTIKVKLTVSPDQSKRVSATIINQKDNNQNEDVHYKRDLNVTISQGINDNNNKHNKRHKKYNKLLNKKRNHTCCNNNNNNNKHELFNEDLVIESDDNNSDICSRISGNLSSDEFEEDECENERYNIKQKKINKFRKFNSGNPKYTTIPNLFMKDATFNSNNNNFIKNKSTKKRSGSLQRQELIEIIQANMEKKYNTSFQTTRKHSNHVSLENNNNNKQLNTPPIEIKNNKTQQKLSNLRYLANIVDPTHLYVDLGSLQNTTNLTQSECHYDKLIDAVMCVSNKRNKQIDCNKKHNRNNTDFEQRYQFLQYPNNDENKLLKQNKKSKRNIKNIKTDYQPPHIAVGHTSSPHHLKHRNRQEDQARAMAQVVNWLEQEFSSNFNITDKTKTFTQTTTNTNNNHNTNNKKDSDFNNNKDNSIPTSLNSGIERHEYHHVHEHIHHHYHHYQETPLVV